jgi:RNA polymerase sigma-70 factor (ECF subfamily)
MGPGHGCSGSRPTWRHSTWRENILSEARELAVRNDAFVEETRRLVGSPEMKAIAREHLAVCFACTLRNLPVTQGAALLLTEVYEFSFKEAADVLGLRFAQVKNAVQSARNALREKYGVTCALVAKGGMCHQCVELGRHFNGRDEDPLVGTSRDVDARLRMLRNRKESALGPWHCMMMRIVEQLLED